MVAGRMMIVANRLPFNAVRADRSIRLERAAGGLVSALLPLAEAKRATWVGWDGGDGDVWRRLGAGQRRDLSFRVVPVRLPEVVRDRFYSGFCNATLWPLFHGFLGRSEFRAEWFDAYRICNRAFADRVRALVGPRDTIWVHDYHLLLLPGMLREAGVRSRILFFLHVPFPTTDLLRHLPWRSEILAGLASADVVGLQAAEHVRHLHDAFETLGAGCGTRRRAARLPVLRALPISIDTRRLAARARSPDVRRRAATIRDGFHGRRIVLSVERLDYAKGVAERLHAIDHLLATRRDLRGTVSFLQLSVPTRPGVAGYERYRREIDEIVGRINGRFSRPEWVPIRYLFRSVAEDELLAWYGAADVALVTSLKDGMNLVAKEFVAARGGRDGVLVLSEFAGAARELRGALSVNPHHTTQLAEAIVQALEMAPHERRRRMGAMYRHLLRHTVHDWVRACLG